HRSRRCSGSDTWGSAARCSTDRSADAAPRCRTRRYLSPSVPGAPSAPVPATRAISWLTSGGLLEQGLIARTELIGPDPLIHRTYLLDVDDQPALRVLDIELVGLAQLLQPAPSRLAVVLVVDPVNGHPLAGDLVEHRMLGATGGAPGGPDVDQSHLTPEVLLGQGASRLVQGWQGEGRYRLADQRRRQGAGIDRQILQVLLVVQGLEKQPGEPEKQDQRNQHPGSTHQTASTLAACGAVRRWRARRR